MKPVGPYLRFVGTLSQIFDADDFEKVVMRIWTRLSDRALGLRDLSRREQSAELEREYQDAAAELCAFGELLEQGHETSKECVRLVALLRQDEDPELMKLCFVGREGVKPSDKN